MSADAPWGTTSLTRAVRDSSGSASYSRPKQGVLLCSMPNKSHNVATSLFIVPKVIMVVLQGTRPNRMFAMVWE